MRIFHSKYLIRLFSTVMIVVNFRSNNNNNAKMVVKYKNGVPCNSANIICDYC